MNNSTTQSRFDFLPDTKQLQIAIFLISFVCGVIGNLLVVWVIAITKKKTVSDLLVTCLAFSDILYLSLSVPANIHHYLHTLVFNNFYCKFILPMMTATFFLCVFTLTAMAVHRCFGILNPFGRKLSLTQTALVIVLIWVMAIIPVVPLMVVTEANSEYSDCLELWKKQEYRKSYTLVLFFLQYVLPLLIISIAYFKIVRYLYGSKVPRVFVNDIGAVRRRMSREENKPVVRTLAAIVLAYALCLLPHQICGLLWDFGGQKEKQMAIYMVDYTDMLLKIHSCLNPIIYGTLTKHFRARFMNCISQICNSFKQKRHKRPNCYRTAYHPARLMQRRNRNSSYTISSSVLSRTNTQSSTVTRTMESPSRTPSGSPQPDKVIVIPRKGAKFQKSTKDYE